MRIRLSWLGTMALLAIWISVAFAQTDPLPSWNDGPAKQAIVAFVTDVTREGSPDFVPPPERIATFDNDGTLWIEQPIYVQFAYALDRVKALAPQHPEWKDTQPFKAVLDADMTALAATGEKGAVEIVATTHAGMTPEEFRQGVKEWLATAKHPRFGRRYDELVYQPMLEVLAYLRANGFKTYIASGGGAEFIRAFAEERYGIPPEQIIGSRIVTKYERRDGRPTLFRLPQVDFVDDGPGKPVGINQAIGRRPIAAFGNSDGDLEMLQWTTEAGKRRLGLVVHHTDAEREYAYDRQSKVGHLDKALEAPAVPGWTYHVTPYGWLTALTGTQTVRGRSVKVDASFIDIVEKSDSLVALMGNIEARNGPFALYGDQVWSKVGVEGGNVRTRTLAPGVTGTLGTSLNLDIEMAIIEVGAAYEVVRSGSLAFDILAGARYWH
jgi:phosphoserine phosphatase